MEKEAEKLAKKEEKDGDPKGDIAHMNEGIKYYNQEIQDLIKDVDAIQEEREKCQDEFENEIPAIIFQERGRR